MSRQALSQPSPRGRRSKKTPTEVCATEKMSTAVNIPPQFEVIDRPLDTQMTISMGPQHPSTHGVLRLELVLDGEMVVRAIPDIGYLHTGMEKLFEYKKYQQGIVITDRMDYLNPLGNNLAYVMAVEKLLQIEIPERAQTIRVLMCELQRIASHLVWLGTHALDLGAMTVFFYTFREREKILNLIEAASGGRLTPSYFRIGGLMMDLPSGFERRVKQFLDGFPKALDDFKKLITGNRIFQKRTQGVGFISGEDAIDWGLSGPSLRGSGVALDIRRANPYTGYEKYDFEIVTEPDGDVWARYLVRMREMKESQKIVTQALSRLKPGPVKADAPKVVLPGSRGDEDAHGCSDSSLPDRGRRIRCAGWRSLPADRRFEGRTRRLHKVHRRTKAGAGAFSRAEFCESVGAAAHVARRDDRRHRRDYRIAGYCAGRNRQMICHRDTEKMATDKHGLAQIRNPEIGVYLCSSVADSRVIGISVAILKG